MLCSRLRAAGRRLLSALGAWQVAACLSQLLSILKQSQFHRKPGVPGDTPHSIALDSDMLSAISTRGGAADPAVRRGCHRMLFASTSFAQLARLLRLRMVLVWFWDLTCLC